MIVDETDEHKSFMYKFNISKKDKFINRSWIFLKDLRLNLLQKKI